MDAEQPHDDAAAATADLPMEAPLPPAKAAATSETSPASATTSPPPAPSDGQREGDDDDDAQRETRQQEEPAVAVDDCNQRQLATSEAADGEHVLDAEPAAAPDSATDPHAGSEETAIQVAAADDGASVPDEVSGASASNSEVSGSSVDNSEELAESKGEQDPAAQAISETVASADVDTAMETSDAPDSATSASATEADSGEDTTVGTQSSTGESAEASESPNETDNAPKEEDASGSVDAPEPNVGEEDAGEAATADAVKDEIGEQAPVESAPTSIDASQDNEAKHTEVVSADLQTSAAQGATDPSVSDELAASSVDEAATVKSENQSAVGEEVNMRGDEAAPDAAEAGSFTPAATIKEAPAEETKAVHPSDSSAQGESLPPTVESTAPASISAPSPGQGSESSANATGEAEVPFPNSTASTFVKASPTPIRPLPGDPRGMPPQGMQNGAGPMMNGSEGAGDQGTFNVGYGGASSRMFHNPASAPSFYAPPQDGPPVGPSMIDASFNNQWETAQQATSVMPTMNNPSWSAPMAPMSSQPPPDQPPVRPKVRLNCFSLCFHSSFTLYLIHVYYRVSSLG